MKQFHEVYADDQKLSTLLIKKLWSNHLHILSKIKTIEEKAVYLNIATKHNYSTRNFARIIDSGTYERTSLANKRLYKFLVDLTGVWYGENIDIVIQDITKKQPSKN